MNYIKLVFDIDERYQEHFIAELMEMDFYGFEQMDEQLVAYVEKPRYSDTHREYIEQIISVFPGASFVEMEDIEEQNWNQTWEQTIQPQRIGSFLVKPTWSGVKPTDDEILLEIDPKMAFGTGYHATTRLILRQIDKIDFNDKTVLDAGTGTGILAIAAAKKGAKKVMGFDFDPWSKENANENTLLNGVGDIVEIRFGGIEQIREGELFDICLANINRNVILELISILVKHTKPGGIICLTGLLNSDEEDVRNELAKFPVSINDIQHEQEWILFEVSK
ncbi:MAG: 50S ribosomal protein L11 methyltransferase [Balneolaceae bacterium]|nr:MAG: 50S ribosomal protein L11 methyltransferase [Balneolaceae bacterium]